MVGYLVGEGKGRSYAVNISLFRSLRCVLAGICLGKLTKVKILPDSIKRTNLNSIACFHILQRYISAQAKILSLVRQLHALMILIVL